jgi:TonB family protein
MKAMLLLSASLLLFPALLQANEESVAVENDVSFTVDFVTFKEAKPKFRPVHQAQPVYPAELLSKHVEGYAVVAFLVDLEGKTTQCQVAAATNAEFGEAARVAIEQWRFTPPQFGGKPGLIAMQLPIEFKIQEDVNASPATTTQGPKVALNSPAAVSATVAPASAAQTGS